MAFASLALDALRRLAAIFFHNQLFIIDFRIVHIPGTFFLVIDRKNIGNRNFFGTLIYAIPTGGTRDRDSITDYFCAFCDNLFFPLAEGYEFPHIARIILQLFLLLILLRLALKLRLGIPILYAVLMLTVFHSWSQIHTTLADSIFFAMVGIATLSWVVTLLLCL